MYLQISKMPSDPQNKADKPDNNVVALHRAEFVTLLERKLSEARRFFSLHDYASCAVLVQEVLAADPQNSKAKALLELSSIKLSKRRLYKKIAEADTSGSSTGGPDSRVTLSTSTPVTNPTEPQNAVENARTKPDPTEEIAPSIAIEPPPRRRSLPQQPPGLPQDSMRERTISALVDLLKNKESAIQDWKGDSQPRQHEPGPPPAAQGKSTSVPGVQSSKPPSHQPPLQASKQPRAPVLKANRDFLPGSLDDLFETGSAKPAVPPSVEPQPPVPPISVTPQKDVATPAALSSPPDKSPETTRALQGTRPVAQIPTHKLPEVGLSRPTLVSQPSVTKRETLKEPLKNPSVPPLETPRPDSPATSLSPPVPHVIQLPDVRIFDQIAEPRPLGYQKEVERKIEQRSEEPKSSEIQVGGAIAQIKKYLYQEEYELCARDLARIRDLFPQNPEIQAFVENTSKRLVELQRFKRFEVQARDLMASAVAFYQEGKREEALIAIREILRVNPNHVQAREFVNFVERHQGKDRKKQPTIQKVRACRSCGCEVDSVSQFCYHCGKKL
jgi:hypothetical protein